MGFGMFVGRLVIVVQGGVGGSLQSAVDAALPLLRWFGVPKSTFCQLCGFT